jgi:eukaryotic-like serine/threonine-protein kinase
VSENSAASGLLQKSIAIAPDFPLAHAALAEAWSHLGEATRAATSAQEALSLANSLPEDERLAIEGRYYELKQDWSGAIGAYRHLWHDFPDDLESGLKLVAVQQSGGDLSGALATLSSLRALPVPQANDPRIDLAEASVVAQRGAYDRQLALAESAAQKALASGARSLLGSAKMEEGRALKSQSRVKEAIDAYREAQQIFQDAGDRAATAIALNESAMLFQK